MAGYPSHQLRPQRRRPQAVKARTKAFATYPIRFSIVEIRRHSLTTLERIGAQGSAVGLRLTFSMIASTEITTPMTAHVPKAHQRFLGSKCQTTNDYKR